MVSRMRSLLDQYRRQGAASLLGQARSTVAEMLEPRAAAAGPLVPIDAPAQADRPRDDVLAAVCAGIALRDLNLVDSLLAELEQMEAEESDPDALAQLYRLDHLATRLRRNAENLRVLAGQDAGAAGDETASLVDVIRAAISAIEQYQRVEVGRVAQLAVVGLASDDVSRLLTELLDNATAQSPPSSTVTVSAHITENGSILLRVEDAGIGLPTERMAELNTELNAAPALDSAAIEHMGLAVVRRLAEKHGVRVWLGRRSPHGTTASVLLPAELVREAPQVSFARTAPAPRTSSPTPRAPAPAPRTAAPSRPHVVRARREVAPGDDGGVTLSGLPRRVPSSLRGAAARAVPQPERREPEGGERFFADLADFDAGEQAARGTLPAAEREDHPSND
ncbi:sensor histidine kinase [Actinokineospora pegani]|uniref:sensor histidine kinase n=1 Tax=Actinokineospora pegani TaxID=2654637 RepID=UPI0012E9CC5F|nr:ATP-binding protein [Actinokineospora pegani]